MKKEKLKIELEILDIEQASIQRILNSARDTVRLLELQSSSIARRQINKLNEIEECE